MESHWNNDNLKIFSQVPGTWPTGPIDLQLLLTSPCCFLIANFWQPISELKSKAEPKVLGNHFLKPLKMHQITLYGCD